MAFTYRVGFENDCDDTYTWITVAMPTVKGDVVIERIPVDGADRVGKGTGCVIHRHMFTPAWIHVALLQAKLKEEDILDGAEVQVWCYGSKESCDESYTELMKLPNKVRV